MSTRGYKMNYNEIAKEYNVPSTLVETEYAKIVANLTDQGLVGAELENESFQLVHNSLRILTAHTKGELFLGMVLAADRVKDNAAPTDKKPSKRQLHVDAYVANPEETLASGKVAVLKTSEAGIVTRTMKDRKTGELKTDTVTADIYKEFAVKIGDHMVVPLDNMKVWPSGKENFSYLRVLPLHEYRTTIIVALKTTTGYKLAELDYNSNKPPGYIPMYVPVEFVATVKEEKDGILHLGTSKFTEFSVSKEDFGKTPVEIIQGFLGGIKYPINKLTEYHTKMVKEGKKWDTLVMVEAYVADIKGFDKMPYLLINDNTTPIDEPMMKVNLHEGIDINFGQNSKVYVIGRTSQGDKWDAETKQVLKGVPGDVVIWAMGVYARFNSKPKDIKPITGVSL